MCCLRLTVNFQSGGQDQERKHKKRRGEFYSIQTSLIVAALKKMLPIGLNMCTPGDQELISLAKIRYLMVRKHLSRTVLYVIGEADRSSNEEKSITHFHSRFCFPAKVLSGLDHLNDKWLHYAVV